MKKSKCIPRSLLIKKLDSVFAFLVKFRDKKLYGGMCPFCGKPSECTFHFVTRSKHSVRWDMRNAVASCRGCNFRYEFDPHFAITWYMDRFGKDAYEKLIVDGNRIAKFSRIDLQAMYEKLKEGTSEGD